MKIISLNVEGQKHLARVAEFLAREQADVVCLMEAVEKDVKEWMKLGYTEMTYAPNDILIGVPTGVAILSKSKLVNIEVFYAWEDIGEYLEGRQSTHCPVVVKAEVEGVVMGAVHYSWTPDGEADERQREHVRRLIEWEGEQEMVLCGDFNIPRGNEMYQELAKHWKDNIPSEVLTTIDPKLHRVNISENKKLSFVVDYIWTTQKYRVRDVQVECGISDHCAVIAEVLRSR